MDARAEAQTAAATGRALELLKVLDQVHSHEELHRVARSVRHELETIRGLVGHRPVVALPPLANPPGEQLTL